MTVIAYYPAHPRHQNPYFTLYHRALAAHGVQVCDGAVEDTFLARHAGRIEAMHIQWVPESIWRMRGPGWAAQLRGVLGFWRYLRLARRLGIKVLWTIHDLEHHEGCTWIDRLGYRLLARFADLCVCHSDWCRDMAVRRFRLDPANVLSIPHGNYDGHYPPARPRDRVRADWGLDPRRRTLLCFGFVRPYKGADLALEALRLLGPDYQLVIAGAPSVPEYVAGLERAAQGLDNVRCAFRILDDQDVADLMAAADCALFPYRKITGSGALAATLTMGLGVVASDLPYFRETLAPEPEAGVLVPGNDAAALADGVRRFFAAGSDRRSAAARRLADLYAWDKVVEPVIAWIDSRLGRRKAPHPGRAAPVNGPCTP
jgi:glycosyltransferase involved in cell wall biosynthesis